MKTIGIKLADGSFYPILEEGDSKKRILDLTTAKDNQDEVHIDLYRFDQSEDGEITNEEYVDTLTVPNLNPHPNGEPNLHLSIGLDENNNLSAEVVDGETGTKRETAVKLESLPQGESTGSSEFSISEPEENDDASELSDQLSSNDMTLNPLEEPTVDDAIIEDDAASDEPLSDSTLDALDSFDADSLSDTRSSDEPTNDTFADESIADDTFADDSIADETIPDEPLSDSTFDAIDNFDADSLSDTTPNDSGEKDEFDSNNEEISMDVDFEDDKKDDISFDDMPSEEKTADAETEDTFSINDLDGLDFDEKKEDSNDDLFADLPDFDAPQPAPAEKSVDDPFGADGFSDLYDNNDDDITDSETLTFGETDDDFDDEDDDEKRSGVPLILCILCVIICVLLTLFLLFIYPSKYNLLGKTSSEKIQKTEKTEKIEKTETSTTVNKAANDDAAKKAADAELLKKAQEEKAKQEAEAKAKADAEKLAADEKAKAEAEKPANDAEAEAKSEADAAAKEAPSSQEDKIVIAPDASKVVPVSKSELTDRKEDIRHSVKWGDTLWDLSETYYKNPWKYPVISDYNKIPNPDYIQAGKDLLIPFK